MSQRIGYTFPTCCLAGSLIFQPIGDDRDDDEEEEDEKEEKDETDNDVVDNDEYAKSKKDDDYNNNHISSSKNGSHNNNKRTGKKKKGKETTTTITTTTTTTTRGEKSVDHHVPIIAQVVSVRDQDEGNLIEWVYRYAMGPNKIARATKGQRYFALLWTLFQFGMPARMPIISKGTFPFTSRCYRFSWTMMLHARLTFMMHSGNHTNPFDGTTTQEQFFIPFDMINLYPECADVVPIQRGMYQASSIYRHADPRTLPLVSEHHGIIQVRQRALIDQFPRHVARVAGGWSEHFFHKIPAACRNTGTGENRPLSVYGVVFSKLNGKGSYCRIFDPTINLAKAEQARKQRTFWQTIRDVVLDLAPPGHEYLLLQGVGSLNQKADEHKVALAKSYPEAKKIEFISDRAACLASRPLTFWPSGFPLGVVVLELPYNVDLKLSRRKLPEGTPPDGQWDGLSEPTTTTMSLRKIELTGNDATMIEFSTSAAIKSFDLGSCGETTEEDVLIALLFMQ